MKRLFVVLVLIAAGIAVLGFSRGWFSVASATADDRSNVTLSVDKGKIQQDKETATGKVRQAGQDAKDKASASIPAK